MKDVPAALKILVARLWPGVAPGDVKAVPLAGDGSERRFWRFERGAYAVVGVSGSDEAENRASLMIGRHLLQAGLPLPEILAADPGAGVFVLEDLGSEHLRDAALRPQGPGLYLEAARLLARFHEKGRLGFNLNWCHQTPYYDRSLVLGREICYFLTHLALGWARFRPSPVQREKLAREARRLAALILPGAEEEVLIHRDFQSRNLMVKNGAVRLIDWQGARLGPAGYDLASLIYDPYAPWARAMASDIAAAYLAARTTLTSARARAVINQDRLTLLGAARLMQALGAYGRLAPAKPAFAAYIPQALQDLRQLWRHPSLRRLKAFGRLIEHCAEAAADRKPLILPPPGFGQGPAPGPDAPFRPAPGATSRNQAGPDKRPGAPLQ